MKRSYQKHFKIKFSTAGQEIMKKIEDINIKKIANIKRK